MEDFIYEASNSKKFTPKNWWNIAKTTNATVLVISKCKSDSLVNLLEIWIDNYKVLRSKRNRYIGGVACYSKNDTSYSSPPKWNWNFSRYLSSKK